MESDRRNLRPKVYGQDTWKVRPNLTLNYGLSYKFESGLYNSEIPEPKILAPILGANNLNPTPSNKFDFGPVVGFAWSPGKSGKTVIRGGGGLYWDTLVLAYRYLGGTEIGPVGSGRPRLPSTLFTNIFPGVYQQAQGQLVPLPIGAPLPVATFTTLTLGQFQQIYNQQYQAINAIFSPTSPQTSGPVTTSVLDLTKSGSELILPSNPLLRSYQTSLGIQRDLGHNMVLTADWARRQFENFLIGEVDLNHYNEYINGVQTPALPKCAVSQLLVASQMCSSGPMTFVMPEGRAIFEGLLLKVNKRFSNRYQFLVSYALQNLNDNLTAVNLNNYMQSYGPRLPRHNLNVSGMVNLPLGFELSVNSSIVSRTPVMPVTTGIDLSGTGATGSGPIPGVSYTCFNLGCGKSNLATAVAAFNSTYPGTKAPNGTTIPTYVLPPDYQFGDPTFAQDFRLTKTFAVKERYRFLVMFEVFNAFNIANLTAYSFNLDTLKAGSQLTAPGSAFTTCGTQTYAFGQPTQRSSQIFLSGGPRAEQVAARFTF